MTRQDFVKNHWKSFPVLPEKHSFLCGRVKAIEGDRLKIQNQDQVQWVEVYRGGEKKSHPLMGEALPCSLMLEGDIVAWESSSKACYLLAPIGEEGVFEWDDQPRQWSLFLDEINNFFRNRHFVHIHTPYLVKSPGVDHHIEFLSVQASHTGRRWCLPTSPEISLKKHLCKGYERIFEIKKCFRDDLEGPLHKVEFTMIEWYRAYERLSAIKADIVALINTLCETEFLVETSTVADCFAEYTDFNLTPSTTQPELVSLAESLNIDSASDDDWNDLFFRIYMEKIEPQLGKQGPVFIEKFPASQASLARIDECGWADRFELYWDGVELANAYLEVNDPAENRHRFEKEASQRQKKGTIEAPIDNEYFNSLTLGMPPASGVALGLDRLYQQVIRHSLRHGAASVRDALS